jgi:hypothetical protein
VLERELELTLELLERELELTLERELELTLELVLELKFKLTIELEIELELTIEFEEELEIKLLEAIDETTAGIELIATLLDDLLPAASLLPPQPPSKNNDKKIPPESGSLRLSNMLSILVGFRQMYGAAEPASCRAFMLKHWLVSIFLEIDHLYAEPEPKHWSGVANLHIPCFNCKPISTI